MWSAPNTPAAVASRAAPERGVWFPRGCATVVPQPTSDPQRLRAVPRRSKRRKWAKCAATGPRAGSNPGSGTHPPGRTSCLRRPRLTAPRAPAIVGTQMWAGEAAMNATASRRPTRDPWRPAAPCSRPPAPLAAASRVAVRRVVQARTLGSDPCLPVPHRRWRLGSPRSAAPDQASWLGKRLSPTPDRRLDVMWTTVATQTSSPPISGSRRFSGSVRAR
jgi:hypothetical protein